MRNWLRGENGYDEPAYRIDRTQGQSHRVLIAAEKSTLEAQLIAWYDERGISVAALRGYGSTPLLDQIDAEDFDAILYVGDFDPTGEDIERVLAERLNGGAEITLRRGDTGSSHHVQPAADAGEGDRPQGAGVHLASRPPRLGRGRGAGSERPPGAARHHVVVVLGRRRLRSRRGT